MLPLAHFSKFIYELIVKYYYTFALVTTLGYIV